MNNKIKKVHVLCVGIFLFHLSICHFYLPAIRVINFFPFYDWNLFSYNPAIQTWPMIRVLEIDHKPVSQPGLVYHSGIVAKAQVSWWVPEQMIRLVSRLESNGPRDEKSALYREELEKNIFHDKKSVKYEIFNAKINVRDYFHQQTILEEYKKWIFEYRPERK